MNPRRSGHRALIEASEGWRITTELIGSVVTSFQKIEENFAICVSTLISDNPVLGSIITSEMSFKAKVGIFRSLAIYRAKKHELPEGFEDILRRSLAAEQRRNTLVHSYWDPSPEHPDKAYRVKPASRSKTGFKFSHEEISAEELQKDIDEFDSISEDLMNCFEEHFTGKFTEYDPESDDNG